MEDGSIVELYWQRDETAIRETSHKYGRYLQKIAYNILSNHEDSEESVNDTYLRAWNSMPPHKPCILSTYLGKITRQLSIDIFRKRNSEKRRGSEYALSLSELEDCADDRPSPEEAAEMAALAEAISTYLRTLSPQARSIFVCRYYFFDSIADIVGYTGGSASKIKSSLYRTRIGLRAYLEKEGYHL